jgi:hypothetical protein
MLPCRLLALYNLGKLSLAECADLGTKLIERRVVLDGSNEHGLPLFPSFLCAYHKTLKATGAVGNASPDRHQLGRERSSQHAGLPNAIFKTSEQRPREPSPLYAQRSL